ncbi:MAG: T9SS type A sorting domain-containing protein, partial [Candidatus Delongbacteria bacterium]|nr:T9SS type A sorting domain-containing protein [Candidatus Delongbacteria bacterium]
SNSVFENCNNGINLVECDNYTITLNKFTGINTGTGVSTTVSGGTLSGNTIVNFSCGVNCILSAPTISNNNICNNLRYGVQISGHNALPHLVNLTANLDKFNNTISNNGAISTSPWIFPYAQIGIKPFGNVYMAFGMNNIYSGQINTIPQIPCISIARYVPVNQSQSLLHNELINAPRNYWGSDAVTIDFFEMLHMHEIYGMITVDVDYNINFTPWANELYTGTGTPTYSSNEPPSTESIQLSNAMMLEAKEKYNACIKQYEHVIKKYIDTPEYYVALARLPYVYLKAGLDTDPLINTYDEGLLSENTSRKKFFKEMKIATHIKSKKYDSAIALAEEMKAEAQCEDEILLADIDIAICNIMKEAENEGKGGSTNSNLVINELLSKLTGDDEKSEPENITENILPTECKLFQNYPNPFNPVTEIKFDLSKTAKIKLCVYNINGQLISELANGTMNAGQHYVDFDGSKLNSGIYYYTLETDGMAITKKMILMK